MSINVIRTGAYLSILLQSSKLLLRALSSSGQELRKGFPKVKRKAREHQRISANFCFTCNVWQTHFNGLRVQTAPLTTSRERETERVCPQVRNLGYGSRTCLDAPARKKDLHKPVGLFPCHKQGGNQYWMLSKTGEIRRDDACLDYSGYDVILYPCHGSKGNQFWQYNPETQLIQHGSSKKCLAISENKQKLLMIECDRNKENQQWKFANYDPSKL